MTARERAALRQRYQFRCGYCGTKETESGSALTVDHFQPRSRGGREEPDNWVYSCHACNEFKSDLWQPDSPQRLLHPLRDNLAAHIAEAPDGTLVGLTETGQFHIDRLRLNRPPIVARRREQQTNARWLQAVEQLQAGMENMERRLSDVEEMLRILLHGRAE